MASGIPQKITSRALNKINQSVLEPSYKLSPLHSRALNLNSNENSQERMLDDSLINKTLKKIAPKVMKYEKELKQIRHELGEDVRVVEISPNKQIVVNLDQKGHQSQTKLDNTDRIVEEEDQYYTFDHRKSGQAIRLNSKSMLEQQGLNQRQIQVRLSGVGSTSKVMIKDGSSSQLRLHKMESYKDPIAHLRISP